MTQRYNNFGRILPEFNGSGNFPSASEAGDGALIVDTSTTPNRVMKSDGSAWAEFGTGAGGENTYWRNRVQYVWTTAAPPTFTKDATGVISHTAPTGDWAGHSGEIASWNQTAGEWSFSGPIPTGATIYADQETYPYYGKDETPAAYWKPLSDFLPASSGSAKDYNTVYVDSSFTTAPAESKYATLQEAITDKGSEGVHFVISGSEPVGGVGHTDGHVVEDVENFVNCKFSIGDDGYQIKLALRYGVAPTFERCVFSAARMVFNPGRFADEAIALELVECSGGVVSCLPGGSNDWTVDLYAQLSVLVVGCSFTAFETAPLNQTSGTLDYGVFDEVGVIHSVIGEVSIKAEKVVFGDDARILSGFVGAASLVFTGRPHVNIGSMVIYPPLASNTVTGSMILFDNTVKRADVVISDLSVLDMVYGRNAYKTVVDFKTSQAVLDFSLGITSDFMDTYHFTAIDPLLGFKFFMQSAQMNYAAVVDSTIQLRLGKDNDNFFRNAATLFNSKIQFSPTSDHLESIFQAEIERSSIVIDEIGFTQEIGVETLSSKTGTTVTASFDTEGAGSGIQVGQEFIVSGATNAANDGTFTLTGIDPRGNYVVYDNASGVGETSSPASADVTGRTGLGIASLLYQSGSGFVRVAFGSATEASDMTVNQFLVTEGNANASNNGTFIIKDVDASGAWVDVHIPARTDDTDDEATTTGVASLANPVQSVVGVVGYIEDSDLDIDVFAVTYTGLLPTVLPATTVFLPLNVFDSRVYINKFRPSADGGVADQSFMCALMSDGGELTISEIKNYGYTNPQVETNYLNLHIVAQRIDIVSAENADNSYGSDHDRIEIGIAAFNMYLSGVYACISGKEIYGSQTGSGTRYGLNIAANDSVIDVMKTAEINALNSHNTIIKALYIDPASVSVDRSAATNVTVLPEDLSTGQKSFTLPVEIAEDGLPAPLVAEKYRPVIATAVDCDSFTYQAGNGQTRIVASTLTDFDDCNIGDYVDVTGATNSANNGLYPITDFSTGAYIEVYNPNNTDSSNDETGSSAQADALSKAVMRIRRFEDVTNPWEAQRLVFQTELPEDYTEDTSIQIKTTVVAPEGGDGSASTFKLNVRVAYSSAAIMQYDLRAMEWGKMDTNSHDIPDGMDAYAELSQVTSDDISMSNTKAGSTFWIEVYYDPTSTCTKDIGLVSVGVLYGGEIKAAGGMEE